MMEIPVTGSSLAWAMPYHLLCLKPLSQSLSIGPQGTHYSGIQIKMQAMVQLNTMNKNCFFLNAFSNFIYNMLVILWRPHCITLQVLVYILVITVLADVLAPHCSYIIIQNCQWNLMEFQRTCNVDKNMYTIVNWHKSCFSPHKPVLGLSLMHGNVAWSI